jgi:hypothetical protein
VAAVYSIIAVAVEKMGGRLTVRVSALGRPRQFHLAGKNQILTESIDAPIGTLPLNAFRLLNFAALETPLRVLCKEGVRPF